MDYGSRYPEAIPLKNTDSQTVATAMLDIFSRLGIPEEILSDQGANFISKLMQYLYKLLGVKSIRTSPYHPQTNGAVERFYGTLRAMLKKYEHDQRGWNTLLPYLLFAYREVLNRSTGFSLFDLMFGRHVRRPLDVLKSGWTDKDDPQTTTLEWMLELRSRLDQMMVIAIQTQTEVQAETKARHDKHAKERHFDVGDQVLVLMPATSIKWTAQWTGPYLLRSNSPL